VKRALTRSDWEEVYYALELKVNEIERGKFDCYRGEIDRRNSETAHWAAHLRKLCGKLKLVLERPRGSGD